MLRVSDAGGVQDVPDEVPPRARLVHEQVRDDAAADRDDRETCAVSNPISAQILATCDTVASECSL